MPGDNGEVGIRVLVVEDDPELGEMLFLALRRRDMEVVTARDGITAVEEARRFRPHVAILDIGLPHLGGHELAKQLQKIQPGGREPKLVALTGDSSARAREASEAAGFAAHLTKPANPSELAELIADLGRGADS